METQSIENPTHVSHSGISHSPESNPSIGATIVFGAWLTALLFSFLGLLIGIDRTPGSFYIYGVSCLIWPVVGVTALGAVVGGALGFVFGSIAHASDEPKAEPEPVRTNPRAISQTLAKSR